MNTFRTAFRFLALVHRAIKKQKSLCIPWALKFYCRVFSYHVRVRREKGTRTLVSNIRAANAVLDAFLSRKGDIRRKRKKKEKEKECLLLKIFNEQGFLYNTGCSYKTAQLGHCRNVSIMTHSVHNVLFFVVRRPSIFPAGAGSVIIHRFKSRSTTDQGLSFA